MEQVKIESSAGFIKTLCMGKDKTLGTWKITYALLTSCLSLQSFSKARIYRYIYFPPCNLYTLAEKIFKRFILEQNGGDPKWGDWSIDTLNIRSVTEEAWANLKWYPTEPSLPPLPVYKLYHNIVTVGREPPLSLSTVADTHNNIQEY